jgi:hypothetical protein
MGLLTMICQLESTPIERFTSKISKIVGDFVDLIGDFLQQFDAQLKQSTKITERCFCSSFYETVAVIYLHA